MVLLLFLMLSIIASVRGFLFTSQLFLKLKQLVKRSFPRASTVLEYVPIYPGYI